MLALIAATPSLAQSSWTIRNPGTTANLWGVASDTFAAAGGTTIIVVGEHGTILTSADDGETWTPRASGTTAWLTAVCRDYGSQRFFAVGEGGTILSSVDGITWISEPSPTTVRLNGVGLGLQGSRLYAMGEAGAGLLVREENGVWTRRDGGFGNRWLRGLTGPAVVGEAGTIFRPPDSGDSSAPWRITPAPTDADLEAAVTGGR